MKAINFKVDERTYNTFRAAAKAHGMSTSGALRIIMEAFGDNQFSLARGTVVMGIPKASLFSPQIAEAARASFPERTKENKCLLVPGLTSPDIEAFIKASGYDGMPPKGRPSEKHVQRDLHYKWLVTEARAKEVSQGAWQKVRNDRFRDSGQLLDPGTDGEDVSYVYERPV